jgi:hypothetical protein
MKLLKATMEKIVRHIEDDNRLGMMWFGVEVKRCGGGVDK